MKISLVCFFAFSLLFNINLAFAESNQAKSGFSPTKLENLWKDWSGLLKKFVTNGQVDYANFDQKKLNSLIEKISKISKEDYKIWPELEQLAFWINAYNIFTVKLILDNYPLKSIRSIGWLPLAAFRKSFIKMKLSKLLSKRKLSLNDIENKILRAKFKNNKIHFAINCASISCPKLQSFAFVANNVEKQLAESEREFFGDKIKNYYDVKTNTFYLSEIFKWFSEDFGESDLEIKKFVNKHYKITKSNLKTAKIKYLNYDWGLNSK